MSNSIKLEVSSILHVPIQNYMEKFTFIVNDEPFETNRLVVDLLSPKISKYHLSDPTFSEYHINTTNKGNFNTILNLVNFENESVTNDDLPFIIEVIEDLEITTSNFTLKLECEDDTNKSLNDRIIQLQEHQKYPNFYSDQITKETDFISEHFSEMTKEEKVNMKNLDYDIISMIVSNDQLQLENEDDLVDFLIERYEKDSEIVSLFAFVIFRNVSKEKMSEFVSRVKFSDITQEVWNSLSPRLICDIPDRESDNKNGKENEGMKRRYKNSDKGRMDPTKTILYENQKFDGIMRHLQKESNVKDEVGISFSSDSLNNAWDIFTYDKECRHFHTTGDDNNPWICIEFKKHEIKPTSYTIMSGEDSDNLKSFVIEGSKDKSSWTVIDEERDISYLKEKRSVHTFQIRKEVEESFKYIQIRPTGPNWSNRSMLQFCSIEFYGEIF